MVIKRVTTVVAPKRAALATVEARATRPAINDSGVATIDETTIAMIDANKYIPSTRQKLPRVSSQPRLDRKSTRLNSSHVAISYAVFCLKKKNTKRMYERQP